MSCIRFCVFVEWDQEEGWNHSTKRSLLIQAGWARCCNNQVPQWPWDAHDQVTIYRPQCLKAVRSAMCGKASTLIGAQEFMSLSSSGVWVMVWLVLFEITWLRRPCHICRTLLCLICRLNDFVRCNGLRGKSCSDSYNEIKRRIPDWKAGCIWQARLLRWARLVKLRSCGVNVAFLSSQTERVDLSLPLDYSHCVCAGWQPKSERILHSMYKDDSYLQFPWLLADATVTSLVEYSTAKNSSMIHCGWISTCRLEQHPVVNNGNSIKIVYMTCALHHLLCVCVAHLNIVPHKSLFDYVSKLALRLLNNSSKAQVLFIGILESKLEILGCRAGTMCADVRMAVHIGCI